MLINAQSLRSFCERVEDLENEKAALSENIKDVIAEAGDAGFDTKVFKAALRERKKDRSQKDEAYEWLLGEYLKAMDG